MDKHLRASVLIALSILVAGCNEQRNAVSGTIEVDEVHVGPRMSGRVQNFARRTLLRMLAAPRHLDHHVDPALLLLRASISQEDWLNNSLALASRQ